MTELVARHAVAVATGSAALLPDIPGLREIAPWTSRDATSAKDVPASLAVIGGGVVAAEMATAYAGFGTKVTLLVRSGLLENMEPFAAELVEASLDAARRHRAQGRRGHRAPTAPSTNAVLALSDGGRVVAEEVLVAIGRTPRTGDLGLESIGLEPGRVARRRRHAARPGHRLAVRGRRREPPRAADPPGQVPGPRRGRRDRRPREGRPR